MSDPDRSNDTEPTWGPLDDEEGSDADAVTEPNDTLRGDIAASSDEGDTDDLLRWLPTLALGHRRRTELVERPSSDGADFAAYACEGRPAATSGLRPTESTVKVQTARGSRDLDRDAPTVLTGERRTRRRWRPIGWASVGAFAAGAAIAGWAERPMATDKALQRGQAVATAPMAMGPIPSRPADSTQPIPPPLPTVLQASPTDAARTVADQRSVPSSAGAVDGARKSESAGPPKPLPSLARRRAAPLAAPPSLPAKDEYFEAP